MGRVPLTMPPFPPRVLPAPVPPATPPSFDALGVPVRLSNGLRFWQPAAVVVSPILSVRPQRTPPPAFPSLPPAAAAVPLSTHHHPAQCGGALIRPNKILTAAHCIDGYDVTTAADFVRVGGIQMSSGFELGVRGEGIRGAGGGGEASGRAGVLASAYVARIGWVGGCAGEWGFACLSSSSSLSSEPFIALGSARRMTTACALCRVRGGCAPQPRGRRPRPVAWAGPWLPGERLTIQSVVAVTSPPPRPLSPPLSSSLSPPCGCPPFYPPPPPRLRLVQLSSTQTTTGTPLTMTWPS